MSHHIHHLGSVHSSHATHASTHARHHGDDRVHVVRRGDDLQTLAAQHDVSAQAIVNANRHLIVDASRPLVVGDRLQIPPARGGDADGPLLQHVETAGGRSLVASRNEATVQLSHYKDVVTLPRDHHRAPAQTETSRLLQSILREVNGVMRPHHAELGNRNRIVHVRGPDRGEYVDFPVRKDTPMFDGQGGFRGTLAEGSVNLNYGQRKVITTVDSHGVSRTQTCVYAFSSSIREGGKTFGASGWVPLSALAPSTARSRYADDLKAVVAQGPMGGDAPQRYAVTGGERGKYDDLKVNPGVPRTEREAAGDYLWRRSDGANLREHGVVNLLYSLPGSGGASTDTFRVGKDTVFVPSAGVPRVGVPLYLPAKPTEAERAAWRDGSLPHSMEFVYGHIVDRHGDRYGWIAADALTPKAA